MMQVAQAAFERFRSGGAPQVTALSYWIMAVTLAINIAVVRYERHAGERLSCELLLSDARHTHSDVWTSCGVIAALAATASGYPLLDPIAALIIVGFIGYAGFDIARDATRILSDQMVGSEDDIRAVVQSVPKVRDAHAVSHAVKDLLMERYPQIADAIIHIEPPPKSSIVDRQ